MPSNLFVPFVFVALFAAHGRAPREAEAEAGVEREPVFA